jgi:hypothetical protein
MAKVRRDSAWTGAKSHLGLAIAAVVSILLFPVPFITANAAEGLSDADNACLACHSTEGLEKKFGNGDTLSLHVPGEAFARSVHKAIGCSGCHADVDLKTHPGSVVKNAAKSSREYSVSRTEVCRQCHDDAFKQYEQSVHAMRLKEGSPIAPVCTGCHGSHSVTPKTAYETCVGCHVAALAAHQKWLPNASVHHEVVSCAACHAPAALRMVDLRLYDRVAKTWVSEKEGLPQFEKLAASVDGDGKGLDPVELRKLVREINRSNGNGNEATVWKTLRGRIELRNNVEAHRLSGKGAAIKGCDNCHRAGAEPFQNVTVSVTGPDGRPIRYNAQKEVLSSPLSIESLPEFYAIGGTRNKLLDLLLLIAVLGGAGGAIGHMTLRWLSGKYLKKSQAAANAGDQRRSSGVNHPHTDSK